MFLVAFQIYTMVFTGYASFTNYGSNHLGDKDEAITSIQAKNVVPVPDSPPTYPCVPIEKDGTISMLVTDPDSGVTSIGTDEGLTEVDDADLVKDGDQVVGVNGYETLNLGTMAGNPDYDKQWKDLQVPFDEEAGTYLRSKSITQASLAKAGFVYDETRTPWSPRPRRASSTRQTRPRATSSTSATDERLQPGWRVNVGFANYTKLVTDETLRSRFLPITAWTFFFAIVTTFLNFPLGLILAMVLNDRRMRGQGIYRLLLIVPFGIPFVLSALVWKAMLNTDFGFINQVLGRRRPLADRAQPRQVLRADGQPVVQLPVLLPGLLRSAHARSRTTSRRLPSSTAPPGGTPSGPWCCPSSWWRRHRSSSPRSRSTSTTTRSSSC